MFRLGLAAMASALLVSTNPRPSGADERMRMLATGGEWVAMAHSDSMIAHADMCAVANMASGIIFRAEADGLEFRATNPNWSLPTDVEGTIILVVGEWKASLEISSNTDSMVAAGVATDNVVPMFTAMDKASSMSVTIGKAKPFQVSLKGSTRATNAFRTCAGINGNAKTPGSNPFE